MLYFMASIFLEKDAMYISDFGDNHSDNICLKDKNIAKHPGQRNRNNKRAVLDDLRAKRLKFSDKPDQAQREAGGWLKRRKIGASASSE